MTDEKKPVEAPVQVVPLGVGLDIGTMNVVAARRGKNGIQSKRMRDVFLDLPLTAKKMLKLSDTSFVEREDDVLILGDAALETANVFGTPPRRPLSDGIISASEIDSLEVLGMLIKNVLGEPRVKGENCYFSVPAAPIDSDKDIIYHRGVFERIVAECGYTPYPGNEAMGIVYSETAKEGFSGIGISFGCLTPDTEIITEHGLLPVKDVKVGDKVLTRTGNYSPVEKTWVKNHEGDVYHFEFYGNPNGVTLTGNHEVWVNRNGQWDWVNAENLESGDVIGEPVVSHPTKTVCMHYTDRNTNEEPKKITKEISTGLARFLGYFLADGHIQVPDTNRESRNEIYITFGPNEYEYVEDARDLIHCHFGRKTQVLKHGNALRVVFSHAGLHFWLSRKCYTSEGVKRFPFFPDDVSESASIGFLVGFVRGDGWVSKDGVRFGNTSIPLVTAFHVLAGKAGFTSTLTRRDARGSVFDDGREIKAENCLPEWVVQVTGGDGFRLAYLVANPPEKSSSKVWTVGGMRCTKIRSVTKKPYNGDVHDLTIDGDHSFVAPYMTLHNSGMTNVALSINTLEGLTFSVARGGDWIDAGAASSVGQTQARICALKEKGFDLMKPEGREQEALAFYYKSAIDYALDNIEERFKVIQNKFSLSKPIPIVVSGGTSLAGGFMDFFNEVFKKRKKFPIEISDIRHAQEPLNAVAYGLLIQAIQEHEE